MVGQRQVEALGVPDERVREAARAADVRPALRRRCSPVCGENASGVTRTRGIGTPGATTVCSPTDGGV